MKVPPRLHGNFLNMSLAVVGTVAGLASVEQFPVFAGEFLLLAFYKHASFMATENPFVVDTP